MRPAQRKILETTPGVRMELLAWGHTAMEPHLFRVRPGGGSGESYAHEGEEFLHVLRGDFEIWLNSGEHYRLKPGDSLYFESSTPHRWKNPGRTRNVVAVDQYAANILILGRPTTDDSQRPNSSLRIVFALLRAVFLRRRRL